MKKILISTVISLAVAVSCQQPAPTSITNTTIIMAITGIELQAPTTDINVGGTYQMTVKTFPEVEGLTYEWESSDTDAATVSQSGLLTAKAEGRVTITAKYGLWESSVTFDIWGAEPVDPAEEQRCIALLTSCYWIISDSNVPGYFGSGNELSAVYWYKANGELWTGRDSDFPNSAVKAATWTLSGNKITETWIDSRTYISELTSISADELTFIDYIKDGTAYYRTYVPFTSANP